MDDALGYGNFQFIQKEILLPLNLNNTFRSLSEVNIEDVMSGYHVGHAFDLKENDYGMHATAEDVGTFLRALNDGSLFEPENRQSMLPFMSMNIPAGFLDTRVLPNITKTLMLLLLSSTVQLIVNCTIGTCHKS